MNLKPDDYKSHSTLAQTVAPQSASHRKANTVIDVSKQSPFLTGNPNAEQVISKELGLPLAPKDSLNIKEEKVRGRS